MRSSSAYFHRSTQCWYWRLSAYAAPVHQPVDHVLVLGAEDPLADDEGLQPQRVQVQADGVQVVAAGELAGVAVLLLGQLDLLGEPRLVPHLARRAPVLDGALRVVVL